MQFNTTMQEILVNSKTKIITLISTFKIFFSEKLKLVMTCISIYFKNGFLEFVLVGEITVALFLNGFLLSAAPPN